MDYFMVQDVKRTVEKIEAALNSAWNRTLDFLGATEKSSLWWKAIFERKILKGEVGISIRWFHSKKMDVLWELESLVRSLSREHQESAEKLREIVKGARHTPSFNPPWTGRDCNVNNYWFTEQDSNVYLHRRKTQENLNTYQTEQDVSMDRHSKLTDRIPQKYFHGSDHISFDFNQSSDSFSGDTLDASQTTVDFINELTRRSESEAQESRPNFSLISSVDVCGIRRSTSCPDLTFNPDSLSWKVRFYSLTKASSLPSIYTAEDKDVIVPSKLLEIPNIPQQDSRKYCYPGQETSDGCHSPRMKIYSAGIDTDNSQLHDDDWSPYSYMNLDNVASHHRALNFLWEDNLPSDMEMQNTHSPCSLFEMVQTVNGNPNKMYQNCPVNAISPENGENNSDVKRCDSLFNLRAEGQSSCIGNFASHETLSRNRKRATLRNIQDNENKNTTVDRYALTDCVDLQFWDNELSRQVNWNAIKLDDKDTGSSVDQHRSRSTFTTISSTGGALKTSLLSRGVDIITAASALPSFITPISNFVSSSYGGARDFVLGALRISKRKHTIMKDTAAHFIEKEKKKIVRTLISDDSPVFITRPLKRTKPKMDLTKEGIVEETVLHDMAQSLKFDVSIQPPEEPLHPVIMIKRALGLEKVQLPKPPSLTSADMPSEIKPQLQPLAPRTSQAVPTRSLIQRFYWWIQSIRFGNDNGGYDEQFKQTTLNDTYQDSEPETASKPTTEAKYKIAQMQAERRYFMKTYKWKQETLMQVVRIARDYYSDPTEINLGRWKSLKENLSREHQSYTDVKMQVSSVPDHFPFFTVALTTVQVFMLTVMCSRHGISQAGVTTINQVKTGIPTFLGTETFRHLQEPNPWIGPPVHSFIDAGALIASCMGPLQQLKISTAKKGYKRLTSNHRSHFGCCEMQSLFNRAGTTTRLECHEMTSGLGKWKKGVLCSARPSTLNSIAHVIKPCCTGYQGECNMMSHEHCNFVKGVFHNDCDHCVQVNCLKELCKLSSRSDNKLQVLNEKAPWLPGRNTKWQWWRYLSGIPLVYGIIHLFVLLTVQITMMLRLEMSVGWHRVMLVYISSCLIGEMVGLYFEPFVPHVGSTSGAGAIIGVAVLELFQAWQFLRCPEWEAIKLLILIILISFLGTFYLISIVSFLTGLAVGMMMCLIVIPYITYGRRLGSFRTRLVLIGLILIIVALVTIQGIRQLLQDCHMCLLMECVPYTISMCKSYYRNTQKH